MSRGLGRSHVTLVNIGWFSIIAAGIGSFVLARQQVLEKRQSQMVKQKQIIERVEKELSDN